MHLWTRAAAAYLLQAHRVIFGGRRSLDSKSRLRRGADEAKKYSLSAR
jgi:hypothetical protein